MVATPSLFPPMSLCLQVKSEASFTDLANACLSFLSLNPDQRRRLPSLWLSQAPVILVFFLDSNPLFVFSSLEFCPDAYLLLLIQPALHTSPHGRGALTAACQPPPYPIFHSSDLLKNSIPDRHMLICRLPTVRTTAPEDRSFASSKDVAPVSTGTPRTGWVLD